MNSRRKIILGSFVDDVEGFNIQYHAENIPRTNFERNRVGLNMKASLSNQLSKLSKTDSDSNCSFRNSQPSLFEKSTEKNLHMENLREQTQALQQLNVQGKMDDESALKIARSIVSKCSALPTRRRKQNDINLRQLISKQKVKNLCHKFVQKLKVNNSSVEPVQYKGFSEGDKSSIWHWEGFETHPTLVNIVCLVNIILVMALIFFYTLELVFHDFRNSPLRDALEKVSLLYFTFEFIYYCITVKSRSGRKLRTLKMILESYLQQAMVVDFINLIILTISFFSDWNALLFIRLFIVTKLPQCLQKLDKLEVSFIKNYYNEQYWSLVKVVLFNFCFAHVLAIFLSAMAQLDPADNWYRAKGISGQEWFPKYIWSYYWGVNIMLTVGFGDLAATNHREALCLIFIEIFSVMCLAYNINWIGTLISNIRSQDLEKGKNFKTFKQLSDKYGLPVELEWRISNYIEESVNIRKKFNIEEQTNFVNQLPSSMRKDFLKQTNKAVFQEIPFFRNLVNRTLYNFAQKIEMSISHPEQMLRRIDDQYNLLILREGEVGFTVKKRNCNFNEMVIDRVKVSSNDRPFVLGLEFLTRQRPNFETKSLEYSVIYSLPYDELINILRDSHMDFLHFCFLRDKSKTNPDEFEVLSCQNCEHGKKHTKFTCPKLHFVPFKQMVIYKQNHREKIYRNVRIKHFQRPQAEKLCTLKYKSVMKYMLEQSPFNPSVATEKEVTKNLFLIKQLEQMKRIKDSHEPSYPKQVQLQGWLIRNTSDLIKQEFDKFKRVESHEDEVWTIESDKLKNFKQYFPEGNACNLEYTFDYSERLSELQQKRKSKMDSIGFSSAKSITKPVLPQVALPVFDF